MTDFSGTPSEANPPSLCPKTYSKRPAPTGRPGDLLWVREAFCQNGKTGYYYRATDHDVEGLNDGDGYLIMNKNCATKSPWSPSIHMPRRASCLTLEITDVRVQRLHGISREDALADGCSGGYGPGYDAACQDFQLLWVKINGAPSWHENPSAPTS